MTGTYGHATRRFVVVATAICSMGVAGVAAAGVASASAAPPEAPTGLSVNDRACGAALFVRKMGPTGTVVKVRLAATDDAADLTARFALWPADRPAERVEWMGAGRYPSAVAWGYAPAGAVQNGGTYVVTARSERGADVSDWSAECSFTVDQTRPDRPPTVASADYPTPTAPGTGGAGVTGEFTLTANGVEDIIGFQYGLAGVSEWIPADQPGGQATVRVAPFDEGLQRLSVEAVDRAGNRSPTLHYLFLVAGTAPVVEDADPDAWLGDPRHLTFRSRMDDVASFTYRVDGESAHTVPAGPDGTALVTVVPCRADGGIRVYTTTRSGERSPANWLLLRADTRPRVTSEQFPTDGSPGSPVGTAGTFTLRPHAHGVAEYVYQLDRGEPDEQAPHTVVVGSDGSATVTFTPTRAGTHLLHVYSRTRSGARSAETGFTFFPTPSPGGTAPAAAGGAPAATGGAPAVAVTPLCGLAFGAERPAENRAQQLARVDAYYERPDLFRLFAPGAPPPWSTALDVGNRPVVVSFKYPPAEVIAGVHDAYLRTWFATAPKGQDVYWTYLHEPEDEIKQGDFTQAEYAAAWVRLRALADTARNPRLSATLVLMGYTLDPTSHRNWRDYYPGRDTIQLVAWDVYNSKAPQGKYVPAAKLFGPAVQESRAERVPFGIAETASALIPGDAGAGRAQWLASAGQYLAEQGARFVSYFDNDGSQLPGTGWTVADFRLRDADGMAAWHELCAT